MPFSRMGLLYQGLIAILLLSTATANTDLLTAAEQSERPRCQVVGNEYQRSLLLQRGLADDVLEVSVFIEGDEQDTDLTITEESNNALTLAADGSDTVVSQMISESVTGGTLYNFTVEFEFDKCPGLVYYDLRVLNKQEIHCKLDVDFTIAGLCITVTESNGDTVILTGRSADEAPAWGYEEVAAALDKTFDAYIVFPNGETSSTPLSNHDLSHIEVTPISYRGQVKYNYNVGECDIGAGEYTGDYVHLGNDECQMGFSQNSVDGSWLGVFFGINFQPYRTGDYAFNIVWPGFTESTYFDEVFETFFYIRITGDAPPAVGSVSPEGPFRPEGNEEITVTVHNVESMNDMVMYVDGAENPFPMVPGTYMEIGNFTYQITFTTQPGSGTNLPYYLAVTMQDGTQMRSVDVGETPFKFDYYSRPVIQSISPSSGSELGETAVTLSGIFAEFDPARGDGIYLNNQPLDDYVEGTQSEESLVLSTSPSEIVFKTPPKPGQSFEVDVTVVIDGLQSDSVLFMYQAEHLDVRIVASGPSSTEDGTYLIGSCTDSAYSAVLSASGELSHTYQWTIFSGSGDRISIPDVNSFSLKENELRDGEVYTMAVIVTGVETGVEGTATIQITKVADLRLGVSIGKPSQRSPSFPNTALRLHADVKLPSCYVGSAEIEYQWSYQGREMTMSYMNDTAGDTSTFSPTKLGREFVIAQGQLQPGSTDVSVRAVIRSDRGVFGMATESINIRATDLVGIIGDGESSVTMSATVPFTMTCGKSFDPDVFDTDQASKGLSHEWSCRRAGNADFSDSVDCENELLESTNETSFDVIFSTAGMFVEYTCVVSSPDGRSTKTTQIVQTVADSLPSFSVRAMNTRLEPIDTDAVAQYDSVVLMPNLETGATVKYTVVSPAYEKLSLLSVGNLLAPPAYWQPGPQGEGSAVPLGLAAGSLKPNTVYEIECEYSYARSEATGKSIIRLKTLEKPRLVLLPMSRTTGAPYTMFSVQALSTIDSPNFMVRFYIEYADGTRLCVGCDGLPIVEFFITQPGSYILKAELWDSLGQAMLDKTDGPTIDIEEYGGRQERTLQTGQMSSYLDNLYMTGDHNGFLHTMFQLAHQYLVVDAESDRVDRALLKGSIGRLMGIAGKSVPSSADGASIAHTCSTLLALDSQWFEEFDQVYQLIQCLEFVKDNTPRSEKLDTKDATMMAFDHSLGHAYGATTDGSTRERLLLPPADQLNAPLLRITEVVSQMVIDATVRDEGCGFEDYKGMRIPSIGHFDFGFKVACNSEPSLQITVQQDTFTWCNAALPESGGRRMFSAVRMADFVGMSRVQGAKVSDSQALLMTNIKEYPNGKPVNILPEIRDCYTMSVKMNGVQDISLDSASGFLFGHRADNFTSDVIENESYDQMTTSAGVTASVLDQAGFATFTARRPGLAGALYTSAPTATATDDQSAISGNGLALSNLFGIASGLLVFIIIAVLTAWVVATRCLLIAAAPPPPLEADETYVERDVYGRSVWAEDYGGAESAGDNGMM